ncbi:hypothetical protein [Actinomyces gaoshouyii]|uniref:hypothetical protein n=1 Tax=Actinomyces gaoshouyii TaxID=1960083 RepID=UPI0009BF9A6A|nr:hypothetical protein [Actinomyces gaoshouyii]ARD42519.1 hypothetical protein B6G06_09330 [Actinomyces gaoshouyii]
MTAYVPPTRYRAKDGHIYQVERLPMVGSTGQQTSICEGRRLCDNAQGYFDPLWTAYNLGDQEHAEVLRLAAGRTGCLNCADLFALTPAHARP